MDSAKPDDVVFLLSLVAAILITWQVAWLILSVSLRALGALTLRNAAFQAWERTHPLRKLAKGRFPRSYGLIERRTNPRLFTGLPLTLMVIGAVYIVALLGGIIEDVIEAEEIQQLDATIGAFLDPYRGTVSVHVFSWITDLGAAPSLVGIALIVTGLFWAHQRVWLILPLWLTFFGTQLTTWTGKFGFDRARPEFLTDVIAMSPSFPSGHASSSMAVYGFMAYAIARDLPRLRQHFEIIFWSLVIVALIGFSRIFLSVHHASDVAAGFLVGLFWLLAGFALAEHSRRAR